MVKKLLKLIIPASAIGATKELWNSVSSSFLRLLGKSGWHCSLFYGFLSSAFRREHRGVVCGWLKYQEETRNAGDAQYLLCRNTHRIEKGLLMRPRRQIFAVEYIEETVRCYQQHVVAKGMDITDSSQLQWTHDVLRLYFDIVGSHPTVDRAKRRFLGIKPILRDEGSRVPYTRDLSQAPPVDYEHLLELARRRKSVRWYLQKPVPRELIDKAVYLGSLSPSACNRQPFEFRIFDEPELVRQVTSLPGGVKGFGFNCPVIVVLVGKLQAFSGERDRHIIYIDGALAAMSFMFALETMGLGSCAISWPDIAYLDKRMSQVLALEPYERVILLISVGYPDPDGMVAYSQRKDIDTLRKYGL